jgi:hypothetical protein
MRLSHLTGAMMLAVVAFSVLAARHRVQAPSLVGLWEAKRRFGPDLRGELVIDRAGAVWRASVAGRQASAAIARDSITFDFAGAGAFAGRFNSSRTAVVGHWIQPSTVSPPCSPEPRLALPHRRTP